MSNNYKNPTKVITGPKTRWSYANVWDPKSINGGTPKYSVSLIIPKSDVATVKKIEAAIQAAYEEGESKLMFYVKETMGDAVEVNIEINDENVFCRCPHCGSEVQVDLQQILSDGDSDLFGTAVLCENCTRRIMGGEMDGNQ